MKFIVKIVLVLFVLFLAAPTIESLIKDDTDVSVLYNLGEEDEDGTIKDFKELKADIVVVVHYPEFVLQSNIVSKIISKNISKHDNVAEEIFLPPPEIA